MEETIETVSPLISIIVPVYKVEPYIRKSIESMLAQTYKNIEVILVDDGSPDRCPEICDEYASKDSRIKVVHKKNEGTAVARNTGLSIANGEYIGFVDSDDYIEKQMYEILMGKALDFDADVVVCNSYTIKGDKRKLTLSDQDCIYDNPQAFDLCIMEDPKCRVGRCLWNKLFRKSLFTDNNIISPKGFVYGQDFAMTYKLIYFANRLVYTATPLYNYILRDGSSETRTFTPNKLCVLDVVEDYKNFVSQYRPELLEKIQLHYTCINVTMMNAIIKDKEKRYYHLLPQLRQSVFQFHLRDLLKCGYSGFLAKSALLVLKLGITPYVFCYRILLGLKLV